MLHLLKEIFSSPWLINDERKDAYAALLLSMLNGERLSEEDLSKDREKTRSYVTSLSMVDRWGLNDTDIPEGSIAVIPIRGEIMKYDQMCGPRGSVSIQKDLQSADRNPKIKSVLLVIDSPGGQVAHTDLLADTIKNMKTPVTAYVEGMAASAAYWIVSSARKVIASSDIDRIGSIGTMLFFADIRPYYEEMGVKFHEIYATKSKDKNKDFNDILEGKYDIYRKETLDVINEKFHASVLANRPGLNKSVLTGKVYFAPEAITLGLIDEIGTFEHAITQANAMADKELTLKTNDMKFTMQAAWTAIAGFFGMKTEEIEGKELTEEMIGQLNDKLADLSEKNNNMTAELADANTAKAQLEEDLAAKQVALDAANSALAETTRQLEALKAEDAGGESGANREKDENPAPTGEEYSFNKEADKFLG